MCRRQSRRECEWLAEKDWRCCEQAPDISRAGADLGGKGEEERAGRMETGSSCGNLMYTTHPGSLSPARTITTTGITGGRYCTCTVEAGTWTPIVVWIGTCLSDEGACRDGSRQESVWSLQVTGQHGTWNRYLGVPGSSSQVRMH